MTKKFRILIECDCELQDDWIWPNNDVPKNPTVKDVEAVIKQCGGPVRIINDWDLDDCVELIVYEVEDRFVECPECAAKPGSPTLCNDCLIRRADFYRKSK